MTKFEEVKRPANGPLTELNNNMQEVFSHYRKMRQYADYLEYELKQKDEHILKVENENSFMRDERTTFDSNKMMMKNAKLALELAENLPDSTDKLSVEKLQEELESCIQTLITISILANGDENIVIGNFVDSRLLKLAKTHENVTKYIEKATGKNIDVVLAENAALEAEEE